MCLFTFIAADTTIYTMDVLHISRQNELKNAFIAKYA
jgi:hypothetical protein